MIGGDGDNSCDGGADVDTASTCEDIVGVP